jgi:hypothetical protein
MTGLNADLASKTELLVEVGGGSAVKHVCNNATLPRASNVFFIFFLPEVYGFAESVPFLVLTAKSSVRNGEAGRPSLLQRLPVG